jgi:CDP-diacylglycerol--glycerol-3-phosphate 3-phosphatidyltransferase
MARPPGALLLRAGVSPNAITLTGTALTMALAVAIATMRMPPILACALILCIGFFDALDGAVARLGKQQTRFGHFLDAVMDRCADAAVLLGFLIHFERAGMRYEELAAAAGLATFPLVSYTRAMAEAAGLPSPDALVTRSVRIILLAASYPLGLFGPVVGLLAAGSLWTAMHLTFAVWRHLARRP